MRKYFSVIFMVSLIGIISVLSSGCTIVFQKGRRIDVERISRLKRELNELETAKEGLVEAKKELEVQLHDEIQDKEVKVEMKEHGLVITFVAEVLFDSGKADLRESSFVKMDKVSQVLQTTVSDLSVGIEGHTDNVPITRSGWKSNWELSTARALSVLHYMEDENGVDSQRLSATGYGKHRPVASNDTKEGRQQNRRVEIVILPKIAKKGR